MRIVSNSVDETLSIGRKIAKALGAGDIICLFGEFGSGKTVLTKGIAQGLGIKTNEIISPSFVFIRQYQGRLPFYHFDLYRLKEPRQIVDLGYEEYLFDRAITVIEWADRLRKLLPKEYLKIILEIKGKSKRLIRIAPLGRHYIGLLGKLKIN
jgi:tRNA threonylcarbamoyladenosine biosynthesis protein TsaE